MGVCQSCFERGSSGREEEAGGEGGGAGRRAGDEASETTRLLRADDRRMEYGASSDPDLMPIGDLDLDEDDEPAEQVQDYLFKTWRDTSDKLIDITHVASPMELDADDDDRDASDFSKKISQDYQRFFHDTFQTARRPESSGGRPTIHKDTFLPLPPGSQNEQDWLREIILRDPEDKSWDCNRVHKIGKPLMISFDDAIAKDESEQPVLVGAGGKTSVG